MVESVTGVLCFMLDNYHDLKLTTHYCKHLCSALKQVKIALSPAIK
jgi:hypothetical protein